MASEAPAPSESSPAPALSPPRRSWSRRIFGWIVKAVLIFLIGSILWVLAYRFVNPPFTFTQLGDRLERQRRAPRTGSASSGSTATWSAR